jgi:hypothetical protein
MKAFRSGREAKEFLISKIVAEARGENASLSEVERKMLYFTESGWIGRSVASRRSIKPFRGWPWDSNLPPHVGIS